MQKCLTCLSFHQFSFHGIEKANSKAFQNGQKLKPKLYIYIYFYILFYLFCNILRGFVLLTNKEAWYDKKFVQCAANSLRHIVICAGSNKPAHCVGCVVCIFFWLPGTDWIIFAIGCLVSADAPLDFSLFFSLFAKCQVQFSTLRQDVPDSYCLYLFLWGCLALKVNQTRSP